MRPLSVLVSTFTFVSPFTCFSIPGEPFSSASRDLEGDLKRNVSQGPGSEVEQTQEAHSMRHGLRATSFILPGSETGDGSKPAKLEATDLDSGDLLSENIARQVRPLRLAVEFVAFFSTGYGLWGLRDDCGDWHRGGDAAPGSRCVVAAVGTAATLIVAGADTWELVATLTNGVNVEGQVADIPLLDYPIHRLPNGPFFRNEHYQLDKRDDPVSRVENAMSTKFGIEVRHIGMWDGNIPGSPKKRHDETEAWPVFAMERDGQDFHFAYMGRREDTGEHKFRLGHGPGIETQVNRSRLKARQAFLYNTQYFDRGGLDIIGHSDIMGNSNHPEVQPDLERPDSYQWLYEQMYCYMDGGSYEALRHHGLWFQVYDDNEEGPNSGTLAAGAIAAFGPDTPSMISYMQTSGGIATRDECHLIGPWKE
ncbi:hypothetical protein DL770_001818 [Monosporascus sp. CRB-9-2]|nr:hypothetical protein DL770_001818 [Monosporascus sp. CRB-9-2]